MPLSIKKEHPASGNGKCKGPGAGMCPEGQWSSKEAMVVDWKGENILYLPDHLCILLCRLACYTLLLECFLSQKLNYLFLIGSSI